MTLVSKGAESSIGRLSRNPDIWYRYFS